MVKPFVLAAMAWLLGFGPAAAFCRQALALGLDVSSSVDEGEYTAQIEGLAQALSGDSGEKDRMLAAMRSIDR